MNTTFHDANRASAILAKIGAGTADTEFARAIHQAIDASQTTMKKSKVTVTVEVNPDEDRGCLVLRAEVTARLPRLPSPATQMHVGPDGELMTQLDFLMGGGRPESAPAPLPAPAATSASGRLTVAKAPAPAPLAAAPTPAPIASGKDAAAGKE